MHTCFTAAIQASVVRWIPGAEVSGIEAQGLLPMAIHEHLPRIPNPDLNLMGWTKARELVKVARREGQNFDSAPWVHKARELPREEFSMTTWKRPRLRLSPERYSSLRRSMLERGGWHCQSCGSSVELEVHHITPRSRLGDDSEANLITLCWERHRKIHSR
jgi:hypothetical protein